jgi:hypothetical protein
MTSTIPLDQAWSYPLFEALYRRRSRRFGLGFEMQEGPFRYKSAHAPVPLTEFEEERGRGIHRARALGSADTGTLPSPKRPDLPDDTGRRQRRAVLD